MHVLMTADAVGGVFTYALELAGALARHGCRVALAVLGPPPGAAQVAAARRVPGLELHACPGRLEWMDDPWDDVARASAWLLDLAERLRPDVVHLNEFAHGALPFRAPRIVVGHSCVCSWFEAVEGRPAPARLDRYRREVARGLAGADLVVAPSAWMLGRLQRHYGPLPRARVIPNGRSPALFRPGEKAPFVLTIGRLWDPAKNAAALDAAAEGLSWPVLMAGDQERPGGGARLTPRHARPLGPLDPEALAGLLSRAAVYAAPARYEPFGLGVLEAALAGCVLVLGDTPSLRETWNGAALFVEPDAPLALRTVLEGVIDRPDMRALLAPLARARALQHSPTRMAEAYHRAYREALGGDARQGAQPCAS